MNKKNVLTIALATGGTGGHVFPAQALAEELVSRGHHVVVICDQRTDSLIKLASRKATILKIFAPPPSKNPLKLLVNMGKLLPRIWQLRTHFKAHKVDAVVGFGGYPTVPALLAGLLVKKKIYLHEQNTVLGRVNRFFARFVDRIFLSFPKTKLIPKRDQSKACLVGNLARKAILDIKPLQKDDDTFRILAIGGSQGARIIADVIPKALSNLKKSEQKKVVLHQQIRKGMHDSVITELEKLNLKEFHVAPFFENICEIMSNADLVISRSGASIIAEMMVMGKASILIPYKYATDDHQTSNAKYLVNHKAAMIVREAMLKPDVIAYKIQNFLKHPEKLEKMGAKAKALALPEATKNIADYIESDLWQGK